MGARSGSRLRNLTRGSRRPNARNPLSLRAAEEEEEDDFSAEEEDEEIDAEEEDEEIDAEEEDEEEIAAEEEDEEIEDVLLYDVISSWYGVTAADFKASLKAVKSKRINLRINSPGGDVFEARAIVSAIKEARRNGKVVTSYIDGLAASAASYIALAADRVVMEPGAFLMIHNAWGFTIGNEAEHLSAAKLLAKVDASIVADYKAKTGEDEETIRDWMAEETWFTAAEAKEHGFVDEVTGDEEEEEEDPDASAEGDEDEERAEADPDEDPEDEISDEDEEEEDEIASKIARRRVAALSSYKRVPKAAKAAARKAPGKKSRRSKKPQRKNALTQANARRLRILSLCGA